MYESSAIMNVLCIFAESSTKVFETCYCGFTYTSLLLNYTETMIKLVDQVLHAFGFSVLFAAPAMVVV